MHAYEAHATLKPDLWVGEGGREGGKRWREKDKK